MSAEGASIKMESTRGVPPSHWGGGGGGGPPPRKF